MKQNIYPAGIMGAGKKIGIGGYLKEIAGTGGVLGVVGAVGGMAVGGVVGFFAGGVGVGPGMVAGLKIGGLGGTALGGLLGGANAVKTEVTGKGFTPIRIAKNWAKKKMIEYSVAADKSDFDLFMAKIKSIAFELFMQLKETLNMNSAGIAAASQQNQVPSSGRGTNGPQAAGQSQSQPQAKAQTPVQQQAKQQPVNNAQNIGNAALKNVAPSAAKAAAPIVGKGAAIQNKSLTR